MTSPPPNDPMTILKQFCRHYTEDRNYAHLVETIKECTFQPNIEKFIAKEKQRKGTGSTQKRDGSNPDGSGKKREKEPGTDRKGERERVNRVSRATDDEAKESAKRVDKLFDTLDEPFDYIFDADIRQWLATDADKYCPTDGEQVLLIESGNSMAILVEVVVS